MNDKTANAALVAWRRLQPLPFGAAIFTRVVQWKAPYFRSIPARFLELEPGRARLRMLDRRRVHNHLGTVHAIALCNAAELTAGTLAEATTPTSHRWIPKAMSVEYLAKASGTLEAAATFDLPATPEDAASIPVAVEIRDAGGQVVFRARIDMWVTRRR